jgi:hypothetical protein
MLLHCSIKVNKLIRKNFLARGNYESTECVGELIVFKDM